jgi:threonine synthase
MKTPQLAHPKLAQALGTAAEVWLKREDLHPLGSHKGRSISVMVAEHAKQGAREFVISSSGNAALAAAGAVTHHNQNQPEAMVRLKIFVGKKIDAHKLERINKLVDNKNITLEQVERPKQSALEFAKTNNAVNLRQSTDAFATHGYHELAAELSKIPNLTAVFIPTSSGTTAAGLYEGFKHLGNQVQLHIAQTPSCHPMVEVEVPDEESIATAIVDNIAHRKSQIAKILTETNGAGYVITNAEILAAQKLVQDTCEMSISPNSALSVAALSQALKNPARGGAFSGAIVCLITGS